MAQSVKRCSVDHRFEHWNSVLHQRVVGVRAPQPPRASDLLPDLVRAGVPVRFDGCSASFLLPVSTRHVLVLGPVPTGVCAAGILLAALRFAMGNTRAPAARPRLDVGRLFAFRDVVWSTSRLLRALRLNLG